MSMDGSSADVACPRDVVDIGDLASAVNAWLTARWPVRELREPDPGTVDLAAAVESWLVARSRLQPLDAAATGTALAGIAESGDGAFGYLDGSLAQAVAESSSRRWVGVHRRSRRRGRDAVMGG
jgi:hypothetical protein